MFQKFLCGGRLIFGPDVASLCVSVLLVAGPAVSFCIKVYTIINHNKQHRNDPGYYWYGVLILAAALTCLVSKPIFMVSIVITTFFSDSSNNIYLIYYTTHRI